MGRLNATAALAVLTILLLACALNGQEVEEGLHTDWAIVDYGMTPTSPRPGETVRFYVKIGIAAAIEPLPQTVEVALFLDGRRYALGPLTFERDPREVLTVWVDWRATAGEHYVEWTVDPNRRYEDPNPANNRVAFQFAVAELPPQTIFVTETRNVTVTRVETLVMTLLETLTELETLTTVETKVSTVTKEAPVYHPAYAATLALLAAILALTAWIKYELHRYGKAPPPTAPPVTGPPTVVERCAGAIDVFMTNLPKGARVVRWIVKDEEGKEIERGFFDTSRGPGILRDAFRATLEGLKEGRRVTVEATALDKDGGALAKASGCGVVCKDKEVLVEFPAAKEVAGEVKDGIYEWRYRYLQVGDEVTLRLKLDPDPNVTKEELKALKKRWKKGIEEKWSGKFACCDRRDVKGGKCIGCSYSLVTLRVEFVESGEHATIRVRRGPGRSNFTTWDTEDTGDVAAHEVGHHLGLKDEYADPRAPGRAPVNTGTVMDRVDGPAAKRHYERICANIGKVVVDRR